MYEFIKHFSCDNRYLFTVVFYYHYNIKKHKQTNNKNELSKTYLALKKEEYSELTDLINAYKLRKASPLQVAGDDTVRAEFPSNNEGYPYNRVPNYIG